jgi:hypothetical protein
VLLRLLLACFSGKLGEGHLLGHDRRNACGARNGTPCPRGASSRTRLEHGDQLGVACGGMPCTR